LIRGTNLTEMMITTHSSRSGCAIIRTSAGK